MLPVILGLWAMAIHLLVLSTFPMVLVLVMGPLVALVVQTVDRLMTTFTCRPPLVAAEALALVALALVAVV